MSSSSDSESEDMTKFLEAADTNFLRNDLFKANTTEETTKEVLENKTNTAFGSDKAKSQRYLSDADTNTGTDFTMPEEVQKHIAKKLTELIDSQVEYYKCTLTEPSIKVAKSRVRLLLGFESYVKPYEEFEYDTKGPSKKPVIKRRYLPDEISHTEAEKINAAVISPEHILNGTEVESWAVKKDRRDKVFHYNMANNNTYHAKEIITEFTQARRKNKWNASKIKRS